MNHAISLFCTLLAFATHAQPAFEESLFLRITSNNQVFTLKLPRYSELYFNRLKTCFTVRW